MHNTQKHVKVLMTYRQRVIVSTLVTNYAKSKSKNTKVALRSFVKRMNDTPFEEDCASTPEAEKFISQHRKSIMHLWRPLFLMLYRKYGAQWFSLKTNRPQHVFQAIESGFVVPTEEMATTIFRVYVIEKGITVSEAKKDAMAYDSEN